MKKAEQGSLLISVIVAIVVISALGVGIATMVTTGVRSSTDHSLSIQALYLAESGIEWAGKELRENNSDWTSTCKNLSEVQKNITSHNHFRIISSEVKNPSENENGHPGNGHNNSTVYGCTIISLGWVGNQKLENSITSRRVKATISKDFIEASGEPDWEFQDVTVKQKDIDDIEDIEDSDLYLAKNVTFKGSITIDNIDGTLFLGDNVNFNGAVAIQNINGNVCIGDNANFNGGFSIQIINGNICFGENLRYNGSSSIQGGSTQQMINGDVCFGDNASGKGRTTIHFVDGNLVVGHDSNMRLKTYKVNNICYWDNNDCSELCHCEVCDVHGGAISQNPADDSWEENEF